MSLVVSTEQSSNTVYVDKDRYLHVDVFVQFLQLCRVSLFSFHLHTDKHRVVCNE